MIRFILVIIGLISLILIVRWYFGTAKFFRDKVSFELNQLGDVKERLISEKDLCNLPELLQNYLKRVGVVGQPRVRYFQVSMSGKMKLGPDKSYAPVKAKQYTFIDSGTRLFLMTMDYKWLPISGIHYYTSKDALMKIKLLDLFKVVDQSGESMHKAETVTYFNDLCIMAPGGLLEEKITWEIIDDKRLKGTLKKHGCEVSAVLHFNRDNMLENFVSEDRLDISRGSEMMNVPWSTPMTSFNHVNTFYLSSIGSAVWHYPEGDFTYIYLQIEGVSVNGH